MTKILIGIAGPAGGGKDTVAAHLAKVLHADVDRFAATLYRMAKVIDPMIYPSMDHDSKEKPLLGNPDYPTRREFLQRLGTEFGRELIHPDLWVDSTLKRVAAGPTILADVRFENEAESIRKAGGLVIHLNPEWVDYQNRHPSDRALRPIDGDLIFSLHFGQHETDLAYIAEVVIARLSEQR